MDKEKIAAGLSSLKQSSEKRSKTARLAEVLDQIEETIKAGASKVQIIEELKRHNLEFTYLTFQTTLRRLRLRKIKSDATNPDKSILQTKNIPTKPLESITKPKQEAQSSVQISHNPTDLDKIISSEPDLDALARLAPRRKK